jgi:ribose/xylose/arabinose/galactoside ABC-type transport system permease subunit
MEARNGAGMIRRAGGLARASASSYGILIALGLLIVIVQIGNSNFLTQDNLFNISEQWAPIAIMAAAQTFVLIGGGFDLSVGGTYAFSATLTAALVQHHPTAVALLAVAGLGIAIGVLNGLLVTKVNINPFITTLGTGQLMAGLALVYSNGATYSTVNSFIGTIGDGHVGPVPVPLIITVVVMVALGIILAWSVYGRAVYAVGGNFDATVLSGMRSDLVRGSTYVLSGLAASLAGVLYVGRIGSGQANIGGGIEFDVISAALIGGISIAGGEGAMWRAAAGVALLAVLQNFFFLVGINGYWQEVVQGVVIVTAVGLDSYSKRRYRRPLRLMLSGLRVRDRAGVSPEARPTSRVG